MLHWITFEIYDCPTEQAEGYFKKLAEFARENAPPNIRKRTRTQIESGDDPSESLSERS